MADFKTPWQLKLHRRSKTLELVYGDDERYTLSGEYLRVYSPSAEVRGHGPGQETLQAGKKQVSIKAIEPTGNYAVQLFFDDGHDTGIYSWAYLYELCTQYDSKWQSYLQRLHEAGKSRDPDVQVVSLFDPRKS